LKYLHIRGDCNVSLKYLRVRTLISALAPLVALPTVAYAAVETKANPICPDNTALFNPDSGQDIVVPPGYKVSVFKSGLNSPTGIAFRGNRQGGLNGSTKHLG
jgi:hypothetical protein